MKRYYITRVLFNGVKDQWESELLQYVHASWTNYKFIRHSIYPPWCLWSIMKYDFSAAQHSAVIADVPQLFWFPQGALDKELSEIDPARRLQIRTKLENMGFDFGWATLSNTVRDVLKYLHHSIQLASWAEVQITSNNFDMSTAVADIPVAKRQLIAGRVQHFGIPTDWITGTHTVNDIVTRIMFRQSDGQPRLLRDGRQIFWHDEDTE